MSEHFLSKKKILKTILKDYRKSSKQQILKKKKMQNLFSYFSATVFGYILVTFFGFLCDLYLWVNFVLNFSPSNAALRGSHGLSTQRARRTKSTPSALGSNSTSNGRK